jgi:hypothetical protein
MISVTFLAKIKEALEDPTRILLEVWRLSSNREHKYAAPEKGVPCASLLPQHNRLSQLLRSHSLPQFFCFPRVEYLSPTIRKKWTTNAQRCGVTVLNARPFCIAARSM